MTEIIVRNAVFSTLGKMLDCFGPPDWVYAAKRISPHGNRYGDFSFYTLLWQDL